MASLLQQFKNPQGPDPQQLYKWAQDLIATLRKGLTLNGSSDITGILPIANGGTAQATAAAARAATGLNVESATGHGDANITIAATERYAFVNAAFTAARTWTLPAASTVNPGAPLVISDVAGGVSGANTLSLAPTGSDKIDGANATIVALNAASQLILLWSDGLSNWRTTGKLPAPIPALPNVRTFSWLRHATQRRNEHRRRRCRQLGHAKGWRWLRRICRARHP
jgi:hypothetical protein